MSEAVRLCPEDGLPALVEVLDVLMVRLQQLLVRGGAGQQVNQFLLFNKPTFSRISTALVPVPNSPEQYQHCYNIVLLVTRMMPTL